MINWIDYQPSKYKKRRNIFQWFLLLIIILGLVYGEYRFQQIELQQKELLRIQKIESALNYPVEFLVVSDHKWGSWKDELNRSNFGITSFICNDSKIDSTLWVNGGAMTGGRVKYYWVLSQGIYVLINWSAGWS